MYFCWRAFRRWSHCSFLQWIVLCTLILAPRFVEAQIDPLAVLDGEPVVRNILIGVRDVFEGDNLPTAYAAVNNLKVNTREYIVHQELLFTEGQNVNRFLVRESLRNLRRIKPLRNISIRPVEVTPGVVDMLVSVQDTWTLIPQMSFSSGTGRDRQAIGLSESNILGYGKRLEMLLSDEDGRQSLEAVWDDRRVWGTPVQMLLGAFDRSDGERFVADVGVPFRSLVNKDAWNVRSDVSDTLGRLFEASDERYVFRSQSTNFDATYTTALGDPQVLRRRYSYGVFFEEADFSHATREDYDILGLDIKDFVNSPDELAEDRRFAGPLFTVSFIEPEFISSNYIDRFDLVEDFNLGFQHSFTARYASKAFGSLKEALLLSATSGRGFELSPGRFMRGEVGFGSRFSDDGFENTLVRSELKYFDPLGPVSLGNFFIGRHTLASSFFLDYGDDLDRDRQFVLGADDGLRGYKARTFTGNKRLALNFEDRIFLADNVWDLINFGSAFFFDVGGASYDPLPDLLQNDMYADVGVGLRISFPRSSGGRVLRAEIALPLRDGADGSGRMEPRFIISGGQLFGAKLRSEAIGSERASVDVGFDR